MRCFIHHSKSLCGACVRMTAVGLLLLFIFFDSISVPPEAAPDVIFSSFDSEPPSFHHCTEKIPTKNLIVVFSSSSLLQFIGFNSAAGNFAFEPRSSSFHHCTRTTPHRRSANVEAGSTVAIFGLGSIGLDVAEGSRLCGAGRIIGVDVNPTKFEIAKSFGVTDFVDSSSGSDKPITQTINEMTGGEADYCFECVEKASLVEEAFACCRKGGGRQLLSELTSQVHKSRSAQVKSSISEKHYRDPYLGVSNRNLTSQSSSNVI